MCEHESEESGCLCHRFGPGGCFFTGRWKHNKLLRDIRERQQKPVGDPLANWSQFSPKNSGVEPSCCGLWREPNWEQVHGKFYCGCLLDCVQLRASFKLHITKVYGRLISRRWETAPEINSYSACAQLLNHHNTFGIWEKRGNQLLRIAWVLILKFQ